MTISIVVDGIEEAYQVICPACNQIIMAEDGEGNVTAFNPCPHLVLAHNDAGIFDDSFHFSSDEMEKEIKRIRTELAAGIKADYEKEEGAEEYSLEDYMDDVDDCDIISSVSEGLSQIILNTTGHSCCGPCFGVTDTFLFKS